MKKTLHLLLLIFSLITTETILAQQIIITGNGNVINNGGGNSPSISNETNFEGTGVEAGIVSQTFVIRNPNAVGASLSIGAISFSGDNASDFTVVKQPATTVPPLGSTTLIINFNPSALGLRSASVSIVTNVGGANPFTFNISGTGQSFATQSQTLYYENFDANDGGWTAASPNGSTWSRTTTPFTGEGNYWRVGNNYASNTASQLTTPNISTNGYVNVKISFDLSVFTNEDLDDGLQVQYSTNNGASWQILGDYVDGPTWYNSNNVTALNSSVGSTFGFTASLLINSGSFNNFIERSAQSNSLDNHSTLRFRFVFNSDAANNSVGAAIDNFFVKGDPITPIAAKTLTPGNSPANLKLWLKANTGTSTIADGAALDQWNDQAIDNHAVALGSARPTYRNGARNINYNPIVDFSNSTNTVMKGKGGFYAQDYFVVVKSNNTIQSNSSTRQAPISGRTAISSFHLDGTAFALGDFTARYKNELVSHSINSVPTAPSTNSYGRAYATTTESYIQETTIYNVKTNASGTATEIYKNGKRIDNYTGESVAADQVTVTGTLNFSEFNNIQYNLGVGRFSLNGNVPSYLDGKLSEIISYSSPKSAIEKKRIESYLAIKNGVTLHDINSTSPTNLGDTDYLDSNGSIIWNTASNSGFNYDIAGIGRDDNTELNQKQSKSENAGTVLTIGIGDVATTNSANTNNFNTNRNFLVWGSNGAPMSDSNVNLNIDLGPTTITTITEVVSRKWKVNEVNGDVPTTRVAVPTAAFTSGLPALGPTDAYVMVVATNAAFTTGLETVFMATTGGNQTCLYDFDGTKYITFGVAHRATNPLHITLDGVDDFVRVDAANDLPANFTVMTWIRPNGTNTASNERTILSKKSATNNGYQIVLQNDNRVRFEYYNGTTLRSAITNTAFPNAKWHNIAFTYAANTLSIYIDGVFEKTVTMTGTPSTSTGMFSIGGQYLSKTDIRNLFKGDIDELRMWDRVLTPTQIQFIMNQEILQDGTKTIGTIIPSTITKNDASTLLWNNLFAYYSMNSYIGTHLDDDSINTHRGSLVIPDKISINAQTAPLPYESSANGDWADNAIWASGSIQDVPNSESIINVTPKPVVDWNIVRTNHNITSVGNKTVLGLFVNNNTLTATSASGLQTDGTKIEVTHYLKLDGKIDLVGRSQLVQKTGSDLDILSSGTIERDQQGQANFYNYNYWGSPVGTPNTTANNTNYTVDTVLRDGTNPSAPANFQWTSSLFADFTTTPKTLSRYWINKFDNVSNNYANWSRIGEAAPLRAGQGFTLKGSRSTTTFGDTQNLVFVGKPNNGTINNTVGKNQLLLVGNPYPSAIDAIKFINDNMGGSNDVITGSLYFWEHYHTNSTHFLKDYQGGYGVRNLTGGTAPSSAGLTTISQFGTTGKSSPNQYIPVGQGFFVVGNATGLSTNLVFNNSQREFIKEDNAASQTMYRTSSKKASVKDHWTDTSDTKVVPTENKKIHIGFNLLSNNFHRQVLLGFMDEKADNEINPGYDAPNIDGAPSDMYLLNQDKNLIIQGEGYFNKNASFPIAVKMAEEGKVSFVIDNLENFDANQDFYIYDAQTDTYNSIKKKAYETVVAKGEDKTRFALHFTDKKAVAIIEQLVNTNNTIEAVFTRYNNTLNINNGIKDATVETVYLYNTQGALLKTWEIKDKTQFYHKLPIIENSSEIYIVKIKTSKGILTQKIIVK